MTQRSVQEQERKALEKYRELYILAKEAFDKELERLHQLDEKAARYFTIFALLLGAFGFFSKSILECAVPPEGGIEGLLLAACVILAYCLLRGWHKVVRVLRIRKFAKIPVCIDFFDDNDLIDIYYGLSKGIKTNLLRNREKGDHKTYHLYKCK